MMGDWWAVPMAETLELKMAERTAGAMAVMKADQRVESSVGSTVGHLDALLVDCLVGEWVVY